MTMATISATAPGSPQGTSSAKGMQPPSLCTLDQNIAEFLQEQASCRILKLKDGEKRLNALHFVVYLGIDLTLEPQLAWIAREMCAAPMPPHAEMIVSKSRMVYFYDKKNDLCTLEHPLEARYRKAVERTRLEMLALRVVPETESLVFQQPEILFNHEFNNLQIPCQDCGVFQSTRRCDQCVMSFCDDCFQLLHNRGLKKFHTYRTTALGSVCSSCSVKAPQCYCSTCQEYFCLQCFKTLHMKGARRSHVATALGITDSELVDTSIKCDRCGVRNASFKCDQCINFYCVDCFWEFHSRGNRRRHTVTKGSVSPLCSTCEETRASIFCEQCQDMYCTDCFTVEHSKGNRQLHLFCDAMNLLLLLDKMDPVMQATIEAASSRILLNICRIQAWVRGIFARTYFLHNRGLVIKVQGFFRGCLARYKMARRLDHLKWRRKAVADFLLDRETRDRRQRRQELRAQKHAGRFALNDTKQSLQELQNALNETSAANPLEDFTQLTKPTKQLSTVPMEELPGPRTLFQPDRDHPLFATPKGPLRTCLKTSLQHPHE